MTVGLATSKHFLEIVAFQVQVKHICDQPLSSGLCLLLTFVLPYPYYDAPKIFDIALTKNKSCLLKIGKTKSYIDLKSLNLQVSSPSTFNGAWRFCVSVLGRWFGACGGVLGGR